MSCIQKFMFQILLILRYNRDMEQKLWFKAKRYGYGWYPVTWQGWGVIALYIVFVFFDVSALDAPHNQIPIAFLVRVFIVTMFLIIICNIKGEKAYWRW